MLLKQPLKIGSKLQLKNRLVMPPMDTEKATVHGAVTDDMLDYYQARFEGGHIGLVITEHSYISQQGKANMNQLSAAGDELIDSMAKLTKLAHQNDIKIIAQINHSGSMGVADITGCEIVAPSPVLNPGRKVEGAPPRELAADGILCIEEDFVKAAQRVKAAGFDGVEIHCAHSYLLNQFYSPLTNTRTDNYGGNLRNRLRILLEIVEKVRAAVGPEYPIAVRLGGCDYMEGGNTIEDAVEAAKMLEQAGIDLLDLSGGMCRYIRKDAKYPGYFGDMSKRVKEAVAIPVILTGGFTTAESAEEFLEGGYADLIGVGRAIMKDAGWAEKAMA